MAFVQKNVFGTPRLSEARLVSLKAPPPGPIEGEDRRWEELDGKLIGESQCMRRLKKSILAAASCKSTVLITGESGTGKELIARALHDLNPCRKEPFVSINCGALTESLLESELFGHVKGAFTGAMVSKKGVFESANRGTIFLDEFGEMSPLMQVRLLRVLQERKVRPVGATDAKEIEFDARVIVATNRNLKREVAEGRFRQDLYYRVNVLQIHAPPLRDHIEDLPLLAGVILERLSTRMGIRHQPRLGPEAIRLLGRHKWPGNVRELENTLERLAIAIGENEVISGPDILSDPEWLEAPPTSAFNDAESSDRRSPKDMIGSRQLMCTDPSILSIDHIERRELELYLRKVTEAEGNLAEAARRLRLSRSALHMRILRLRRKLSP